MSNYKTYFAIEKNIKAIGYEVDRAELIETFTECKKSSLKELTPFEYNEFIRWLNSHFDLRNPNWKGTPEDKMRKKLIMLFVHEMDYTMEGLDLWCVKYGKFHKKLMNHNKAELSQLIAIAEKVHEEYMIKLTK